MSDSSPQPHTATEEIAGLVDAAAVWAARVKARHSCREAALVQKDQVFRRRGADLGDKFLVMLAVGFAVSLLGVE